MDPVYGFYNAVLNGDERGVSRYMALLTPRLTRYLEYQMGANRAEAREVVNHSMAYLCEGILQGQIAPGEGLLKYFQLTCRHGYIKYVREMRRSVAFGGNVEDPLVNYDQLDSLLKKERQMILEGCIRKFSPENQAFVRFLVDHPGCDPLAISEHFGLSLSNFYTKKSRILKLLADCVRREENR